MFGSEPVPFFNGLLGLFGFAFGGFSQAVADPGGEGEAGALGAFLVGDALGVGQFERDGLGWLGGLDAGGLGGVLGHGFILFGRGWLEPGRGGSLRTQVVEVGRWTSRPSEDLRACHPNAH